MAATQGNSPGVAFWPPRILPPKANTWNLEICDKRFTIGHRAIKSWLNLRIHLPNMFDVAVLSCNRKPACGGRASAFTLNADKVINAGSYVNEEYNESLVQI